MVQEQVEEEQVSNWKVHQSEKGTQTQGKDSAGIVSE